jgi:hypothetical protein
MLDTRDHLPQKVGDLLRRTLPVGDKRPEKLEQVPDLCRSFFRVGPVFRQ